MAPALLWRPPLRSVSLPCLSRGGPARPALPLRRLPPPPLQRPPRDPAQRPPASPAAPTRARAAARTQRLRSATASRAAHARAALPASPARSGFRLGPRARRGARSLLQELREQHVLQKSSSHCQDEDQWQLQKAVESHILEEEEKLEEETQQTHLEFHQQLVTEIQEALHFLQQHMEQVIGQTLLQHARQEAAKKNSDDGLDFKERLVETAVESVYVTSNNITRLVQNYYQQLGKITECYEGKKLQQLKSLQERGERSRLRKKQENEQALKEKPNKGLLDISSAVHQRMVLQQKKVLAQFELQEQIRLESLKQKMLGLHQLETELENQLQEAEQDFVTELATLAHVPLPMKKQLSKRSKPTGEKTNAKRKTFQSPESEDKGDSHENIQEPPGQTSGLYRDKSQSSREGETEPRKNSKMLKKGSNR